MDLEHINQCREFVQWARNTLDKLSTFEIDFWAFCSDRKEKIEFRIYVEGIINKSSTNLSEIVSLLPKFQKYCELNKEFKI